MITLLANIFLKSKDEKEPAVRKAYGTLCSTVGIVLNIVLFIGKYFAGAISGSIAIMADAFNNLSDAGSSFITLVGFWFAGKKPDIDHPFGHGRFEYISGLGVAVMIILMGFELAKDSVWKILYPKNIEADAITIIILCISIGIKLYMSVYNRKIGQKIDSAAMKATAADSLSDAAATTVVLVSILINKYTHHNVDGICGLVVSLVIMYAGFNVMKETISPLLGQSPKPEFVDAIYDIVMSHEGIIGIHDLIVHDYGPGRIMISLHTEVSGDGNIFKIHDLIDRIENELNKKLGCEAVIHMDPIEINNKLVNEVKNEVINIISDMNMEMSIHDFRMVSGDTHTNLIFDVLVPYSVKISDDELIIIIKEKISEHNNTYFAVIHIDRDYNTKKGK